MRVYKGKTVIYMLGGALGLMFLILHFWFSGKTKLYRKLNERLDEDIKLVSALREEAQKFSVGEMKRRILPPDFSLFSYVEGKAREAGLNVRSITPSGGESKGSVREVSVILASEEADFTSLVKFLENIEKGSEYNLRITKCNVERSFKNPGLIDAKIEITAFQREK